MLGAPPNCRPECLIHQDCPTHLACLSSKCRDPCQGSCGLNSRCTAHNHQPICSCNPGFEGDPFSGCSPSTGRIVLQSHMHVLLFSTYRYYFNISMCSKCECHICINIHCINIVLLTNHVCTY